MQLSNNRGEANTKRWLADRGKVGPFHEAVKAVSCGGNILVDSTRPASVSQNQNWLTKASSKKIRIYGPVLIHRAKVILGENLVKTTYDRQLSSVDQVHIRWMIRRDMAEILCIEEESFEFPWADTDFTRCLRQRNCIGVVAEISGGVVGYMLYELHRTKVHVLNFAVARTHRRLGIGTAMLTKLISKLSTQRRNRIVLEVRETNLPAQVFFRSLGFLATSVLRDFYQDTTEDAYLMHFLAEANEDKTTRRLAG
jgi:ribosomal-protein-alanine N-acetyltransferase